MRRILSLFLAAMLGVVPVLAGCGGEPPDDGPAPAPTAGSAAPTGPAPPGTVTPPTAPPGPSSDALWESCQRDPWTVEAVGELESHLTSVSGLAASWLHPGVVWAVEDSFEPPVVTAMDDAGRVVATVTLAGHPLMNLDWEDLAVGAGPDGAPWIHVADIGDNVGLRSSVQVHRFPEPVDLQDASVTPETVSARYDGGRRPNAEAFLVDAAGTGWVIDKVDGGDTTVFRLDRDGVLRATGTVDTGGPVTAVDLSADAGLVALRTPDRVRLYRHAPGADVAATLAGGPCELPAPDERQGESLAFRRGALGLLSVSEDESGSPVTLHRILPAG